jgi:hypothetical protein
MTLFYRLSSFSQIYDDENRIDRIVKDGIIKLFPHPRSPLMADRAWDGV